MFPAWNIFRVGKDRSQMRVTHSRGSYCSRFPLNKGPVPPHPEPERGLFFWIVQFKRREGSGRLTLDLVERQQSVSSSWLHSASSSLRAIGRCLGFICFRPILVLASMPQGKEENSPGKVHDRGQVDIISSFHPSILPLSSLLKDTSEAPD